MAQDGVELLDDLTARIVVDVAPSPEPCRDDRIGRTRVAFDLADQFEGRLQAGGGCQGRLSVLMKGGPRGLPPGRPFN